MQFDATMSEVSAISGATGDEFQKLRDKALEMGAKTKFSASEAAEAMTYMGMAGWKSGDMIDGIAGIMNLAAASGEDLALTSDIVTDALTAFGKSAKDSGHLADIMAAASSNANTNVAMLGESFKYVAPVAGALGYSMEDTSIALGLMANSGIKASQAGTSLRTAMTNMASPTKNMAAVMDTYGISLTNADGSMKSLQDVMIQLREKMGGLDEATQASAASMLFGKEAMSGMLAIINAAPSDFEKLTGAIYDCNDAAEEMSKTMMDNLQGDITLLKSAFESLQIAISDSLTPSLREFAQFGQKAMANLLDGFQGSGVSGFMNALSGIVTDGVNLLAEKAPAFADVSVQFISALAEGLINSAPNVLNAAVQVVNTLVSGISTFLGEHSSEMVEIGRNVIDMISSGFKNAVDAVTAHIGEFIPLLAEGFLTYHETLLSVGLDILGAIGQGIVENKDEIQHIASETIANMVTSIRENAPAIIEGGLALLEALSGSILDNLTLIMETGMEIVSNLASGIGEALPNLIPAAVESVLKFIEGLTSPESLSNLIGGALQLIEGLIEGITKSLPLLIAYAPEIIANLVTGIIAAIPQLIEVGIQLIQGLIEGLVKGILAIPEAIARVVGAIVDGFKALFGIHSPSTVFAEMGENLIAGLLEGLSNTWQSVVDFFSEIWTGIKSVFEGAVEFFDGIFASAASAVQGAWSAVVDFFSGIWDGIQGVFSTVAETLGKFFSDAWDLVQSAWGTAKEFFGNLWDGIKEKSGDAAEFIKDKLSSAWDGIKTIWDNAKSFFGGIFTNIMDKGREAAESIGDKLASAYNYVKEHWDEATPYFSGMWENIKNVFGDAWDAFKSIGGNIVGGIKDGISSLWGSFTGWFKDKFSGLVDGAKNLLGIHSPSKVFADIGKNVMLGLEGGIDGENGSIGASARAIITTIKESFSALAVYCMEIGRNAMASLADAMSSGISALQQKVAGLMSSIAAAAKAALGIHSPSTVFAGIGENMALGLEKGWESEYSGIKRTIKNGMDFGVAKVGIQANTGKSSLREFGGGSMNGNTSGGMTVNIYNPEKRDAVTEAREWQKTSQRIAMGLV